jgi:hypothetical protein
MEDRLVVVDGNRLGVYERTRRGALLVACFVDEDWSACTDASAIESIRTARYEPLGENDPL